MEPRSVRRSGADRTSTRATRARRNRPQPTAGQDSRPRRDARPWILCQRRARQVHGPRLQRGGHPGSRAQRHDLLGRARTKHCRIYVRARERAFSVDLFNEGLDVPEVDTVLFLRPTESATVFLQQLGRGLRRTADKAVLTVLDFVGYHRKEFRFDLKLRALTGQTRRGLERDIERGLPVPPVRVPDRDGPARRRRSFSRTSRPRSQTAGNRSLPSCGPTATRTSRTLPRRVRLELSDILRRGATLGPACAATLASRPVTAPRSRRGC